jgi:phage repressor protein C with HTH and peptisase S24 domain
MSSIATTRRGEYSLLELALPGRGVEVAGVILHDPDGGQIDLRMRRDWDLIADEDDAEVLELLENDLRDKAAEMGAQSFLERLEDTLSNILRIADRESVLLGNFDSTLNSLYQRLVPATVQQFVTHLPIFSVQAAAGSYGGQMEERPEPDEWVETPSDLRLTDDMFVATVTGRSMEPKIPAGSRCIFRHFGAGSREGRLMLVQNLTESDEGGQRYTIKRYYSRKVTTEDGWQHSEITMEPLNPEFEPWQIDPEAGELEQIRILAEFVRVLD